MNKLLQEFNTDSHRSSLNHLILELCSKEVRNVMKKVILLSVLAVSLTGCVLDPYDDDYGHRDRNGHYDRHHGDRDWNNKDRPDWNHDRTDRDRHYNR